MKKIILKTFIILSVATIVIPLLIMILYSFVEGYPWPSVIPQTYGNRGWNYIVLNSDRIISSLKYSFMTSAGATTIAIIISIPCAKALALEDFKGKKIVEYIVLSPILIPSVAIAMGLNIQFIKMGISGTLFGVILVMIVPCIPYSVNMIKDVYIITGRKYSQQAYTLGAGKMDVFFRVTLPMIMPGVVSAAMMCYIVSFSQYFLVMLIGGGKIVTFTMDMFPFIQSGDRMLGSVYGIIFIFSTVISLIVMEWIVKRAYRKELEDYMFL